MSTALKIFRGRVASAIAPSGQKNRVSRRQFHVSAFRSRSVIEEMEARGLITAITHPELKELVSSGSKCAFYGGFDPTGPSLHVGHLVMISAMSHLKKAGLQPIALVGGATGLIGDPSGRSEERPLISEQTVQNNVNQLHKFLKGVLGDDVKMVNNYDWYKDMSAIQFLRGIGKHFRVSTMLQKDSVKNRLADSGLSFTEFSYQILQSYDFYHLFQNENCKIQLGGNDQWGNITAGTDLIRRLTSQEAFGATVPLLTTASGQKISKSTGNAVWLNADYDSPYTLYQFFMRLSDADIEHMLKLLTPVPLEKIAEIVEEHMKAPEKREGQRILGSEVTKFVHGEKGLALAQSATNVLFGGNIDASLKSSDLVAIFKESGCLCELSRDQVVGQPVVGVAAASKLVNSKGDAKRLADTGGLYVNNKPVSGVSAVIQESDLIDSKVVLLRSGKKNYKLVMLTQ